MKKQKNKVNKIEKAGFGKFPVCIAKTQYSFSTDPKLKGAPSGHTLSVREVRLSSGAEFLVVVCGSIMTMPGLPRVPAAENIKLNKKVRSKVYFRLFFFIFSCFFRSTSCTSFTIRMSTHPC